MTVTLKPKVVLQVAIKIVPKLQQKICKNLRVFQQKKSKKQIKLKKIVI